jgi:formate hydrogenlyase subunit 3/multisubunit Na+/H+ antiporter MnhD subunit
MNTSQKISLLVCVFSVVVFIISAYSWGYSEILEEIKWDRVWSRRSRGINYVGMFSLGLSVASLVGYFVLGDKKK